MMFDAKLRAGRSSLLRCAPLLFAAAAVHCARGDGEERLSSADPNNSAAADAGGLVDGGDPGTSDGTLPPVLPALRDWAPDHRAPFTWLAQTRVVAPASLTSEARTFAEDLAFATNGAAPQVVSLTPADAVAGDIVLGLDANDANDASLAEEGYQIEIGRILRIKARSARGAFWGTRTVLQRLRQSRTLSSGVVRDRPQNTVRPGLFDTGNPGRH